jgi:hypothetical protein
MVFPEAHIAKMMGGNSLQLPKGCLAAPEMCTPCSIFFNTSVGPRLALADNH